MPARQALHASSRRRDACASARIRRTGVRPQAVPHHISDAAHGLDLDRVRTPRTMVEHNTVMGPRIESVGCSVSLPCGERPPPTPSPTTRAPAFSLLTLSETLAPASRDKSRTQPPCQASPLRIALSRSGKAPAAMSLSASPDASPAPQAGHPGCCISRPPHQLARARRWGGPSLSISARLPQHAAQSQAPSNATSSAMGGCGPWCTNFHRRCSKTRTTRQPVLCQYLLVTGVI